MVTKTNPEILQPRKNKDGVSAETMQCRTHAIQVKLHTIMQLYFKNICEKLVSIKTIIALAKLFNFASDNQHSANIISLCAIVTADALVKI